MSLSSINYTLSDINAILRSSLRYAYDKQAGDRSGAAELNFGFNVTNGLARNWIARDYQRHTGSYLGYTINSLTGYGNAVSNYYGTMGLSMLTNPFRFGGCRPMFGGLFWNYGFGGGYCNPMFGNNFLWNGGCWCC